VGGGAAAAVPRLLGAPATRLAYCLLLSLIRFLTLHQVMLFMATYLLTMFQSKIVNTKIRNF
jgi:hypothetical protein